MPYTETLASLRTKIADLIPDASIGNAHIDSWIKAAHLMFPGTYFVDHQDETVVIAASTYEYNLGSPATFATVHRITIEGSTAGVFDGGQLDLGNHCSFLWNGTSHFLQLKKSVNDAITAGRKLRIEGQKKYTIPSADGSNIELHNGWVLNYVLYLAHQSRGGSGSDLASWHQRMAGVFYQAAKDIEDNIPNRGYPGAVLLPGVF